MKKQKTGFTLIEVLVVIGIFTLIIGASFSLLSTGRLSASITEAQIQAEERARRAIERISRELRLSNAFKLYIYDTFVEAGGLEVTTGPVIYFQIPVGSYDSQLDLEDDLSLKWGDEDNKNRYIVYFLDPNNPDHLIRGKANQNRQLYNNPNRRTIISSGISSLSFSRQGTGSNLIKIEVEAQGQAGTQTATHTLSSTVKLMN